MDITIPILISICSLGFSVYIFLRNGNRDEATQITTVIIKLEAIAEGITEIKSDVRTVKDDIKELRERTAKLEASASSAHKRIDFLEGKGEPR